MAARDIEAFLRQRASTFDPNMDVAPGSPFDTQVIQPLLRRLGADPFSMDLSTFITDRLTQAFPTMATKEGDAITDLLTKPATLLWDPIVREIKRVSQQLSLKDPTTLTLEEGDSLGANFFRPRAKGDYAKGTARILFAQPQGITVSSANYFTAKGGLLFYPVRAQSIRMEEMLQNVYESYYYFDISVVADKPGVTYNIGPNELQAIANLSSVARVLNLRRFDAGSSEENVVEYVDRLDQELGEKSLVSLRGIASKIKDAFPEMTRLNVVGFNDPEMLRDVITGGGLGALKAYGVAGSAVADGEGMQYTRRFYSTEVDFATLLTGDATSWVLTVFGATGAVVLARDIQVASVFGEHTVDLAEQVLHYGSSALTWTARKKEITLDSIPGGILFPDSQNGTVAIPDNEVHVGGAFDVHTRGSAFDSSSLAIDNITDDTPLASGNELLLYAYSPTVVGVKLQEYVLGVDYSLDDDTYAIFASAELFGYSLQILEGVDAGTYRITGVTQANGNPVELLLDPAPTNAGATLYRWRLFDEINVDLLEPKETRISGDDLRTVQGSSSITTDGGTNFDTYGVAEGDVLRILNGASAGDYGITADPVAPGYAWLVLDKELSHSQANLQYSIFRPNTAGGLTLPLVRVTSIDLLDSSKQTVGTTIPYAKAVDVQTRAFQNPRRGIKHDLTDVNLGLISNEGPFSTAGTLVFEIEGTLYSIVLAVLAPPMTAASAVAQINAQMAGTTYPNLAVEVGSRVGIRPVVTTGVRLLSGTAMVTLFGTLVVRSTADVVSASVPDWAVLDPALDFATGLDVLQVLDGANVGYYPGPFSCVSGANTLWVGDVVHNFAPEEGRRVQVGSRSIGSARMYFLEPTSVEVDGDTRFSVEYNDRTLNFLPDPTLDHQRIPALPNGTYAGDGVSMATSTTFTSAGTSFLQSGIQAGDKLYILTHPVAGTAVLNEPVSGLVYLTFVYSLDSSPDQVLTFIRDDLSLAATEVSRQSVVDQINASVGKDIASLTATNTIQFDTELALVIRKTGTANTLILGDVSGTAPAISFSAQDVRNDSPHAVSSLGNDYYEVTAVGDHTLTITPAFAATTHYGATLSEQYFEVWRSGVQRICTTAMSSQLAEASLYYFDVELVSEGTGDHWNVPASLQMTPTLYRSDGYWLTTNDSNLTFSDVEQPQMVLSRTLLSNGVNDDPQNATQVSGQNILVNYEYASMVSNVQGFMSSETERVVCSSPLSRHLIPHFVRFDFTYSGGSKESVVVPNMEDYIKKLFPMDALESSDLQKVALDRGATSIQNPIDIIAVVHYPDRHVYVARSQNALTTGRLAAFIPDVLNVTRRTV